MSILRSPPSHRTNGDRHTHRAFHDETANSDGRLFFTLSHAPRKRDPRLRDVSSALLPSDSPRSFAGRAGEPFFKPCGAPRREGAPSARAAASAIAAT